MAKPVPTPEPRGNLHEGLALEKLECQYRRVGYIRMSEALVANNLPIPSVVGSLDAYIGAVHRIPVLAADEEHELAQRYRED